MVTPATPAEPPAGQHAPGAGLPLLLSPPVARSATTRGVALLATAGFALAGLLATRVVPPGPPHPGQPEPHRLFRHHAGGIP